MLVPDFLGILLFADRINRLPYRNRIRISKPEMWRSTVAILCLVGCSQSNLPPDPFADLQKEFQKSNGSSLSFAPVESEENTVSFGFSWDYFNEAERTFWKDKVKKEYPNAKTDNLKQVVFWVKNKTIERTLVVYQEKGKSGSHIIPFDKSADQSAIWARAWVTFLRNHPPGQ